MKFKRGEIVKQKRFLFNENPICKIVGVLIDLKIGTRIEHRHLTKKGWGPIKRCGPEDFEKLPKIKQELYREE
jgi:hypothetical protein